MQIVFFKAPEREVEEGEEFQEELEREQSNVDSVRLHTLTESGNEVKTTLVQKY